MILDIEIIIMIEGINKYLKKDMLGLINIRLSLLTIEKISLISLKSAYLINNETK